MVEPLTDAMHDGIFETVVMQNRRIDKGRQFRFAADDFLSLIANASPDRIDGREGWLLIVKVLGHCDSSG